MADNFLPLGTDFYTGPSLGDLGVGGYDYSSFPDLSNIFAQSAPAASAGGGGGLANIFGGVTRLAGSIGDIFRTTGVSTGIPALDIDEQMKDLKKLTEESTEKLDTRSEKTLSEIRDIFDEIRGLTGVATADAVQDYYKRFDNYMTAAMDQARKDLATQPDLTRQYDTLKTRIGDVRSSDLNLLNSQQFMDIAKRPQDYMSTTNVDAIKDVMTLGPEYRQHYSYSDPETQGLMRGRPNAVQEYASFFANSPEIRGMMEYKV